MSPEHAELLRAGWHLVCCQARAAAKDHRRPLDQLGIWLLDLRGECAREIASWVVTAACVRRRLNRRCVAAPIPLGIGMPIESMAAALISVELAEMADEVAARPANTITVVLIAHNDEPELAFPSITNLMAEA